jgi:hypothetical protein
LSIQSAECKTFDYQGIKDTLFNDGWRTPNTYCKHYAQVEQIPAIYMFVLVDNWAFKKAIVAYVGMSLSLKSRLANHEMNSQLDIPNYSIMRWFKPIAPDDLRSVERAYIRKYDPPWNIAGRTRGLVLQ